MNPGRFRQSTGSIAENPLRQPRESVMLIPEDEALGLQPRELVVERICMERSPYEVRQLKNTVTLEGALCSGKSIGCGRACFCFWREAWLRRAPED
jgi:hypothetical protein